MAVVAVVAVVVVVKTNKQRQIDRQRGRGGGEGGHRHAYSSSVRGWRGTQFEQMHWCRSAGWWADERTDADSI